MATQANQDGANWVWLSVIPLGLGAWAPAYAGAVVRRRRWVALGLLWSIITLAGWVVAIGNHGGSAGGLLIILGWTGAIATSFAIRAPYRQLSGSSFETALTGAEQRLSDRDRARKLAAERPTVAKELGIGRPDLPNAQESWTRAPRRTGSHLSRILVWPSIWTGTSFKISEAWWCSSLVRSKEAPALPPPGGTLFNRRRWFTFRPTLTPGESDKRAVVVRRAGSGRSECRRWTRPPWLRFSDRIRGQRSPATVSGVQNPAEKALVAVLPGADECDRESAHGSLAILIAPAA